MIIIKRIKNIYVSEYVWKEIDVVFFFFNRKIFYVVFIEFYGIWDFEILVRIFFFYFKVWLVGFFLFGYE